MIRAVLYENDIPGHVEGERRVRRDNQGQGQRETVGKPQSRWRWAEGQEHRRWGQTRACQAPPSMEFSRQEYWSVLPCPPPGIFLIQESNQGLLHCKQILYQLSYEGSLHAS